MCAIMDDNRTVLLFSCIVNKQQLYCLLHPAGSLYGKLDGYLQLYEKQKITNNSVGMSACINGIVIMG